MKVAIDARLLQGRFTGDRTYWRGLLCGLSKLRQEVCTGSLDEYILYTFPKMPPAQPAETHGFQIRPVKAFTWRDWSLWAFPRALKADGVDVCHVQYSIPPFAPCPVITSVHDISFRVRPEFFRFKDRFLLDKGMRYAAKYSAKILAISEFTKSEIVSAYRVSDQKVEVVYPGVDEKFRPLDKEKSKELVRQKYGMAYPYVISVGVLPPRKNIPCLIQAFACLKQTEAVEHKLVIVGKLGNEEASLRDLMSRLAVSEDVYLLGYVPDEDLPALYACADICVYPSLYEGFGLPVLEAMACGTPVITGNESSLPEVVGDAGITVCPRSPEAFADAMARLLRDASFSAEMSARGLARARTFSWEKMARRVTEIYHEVVGT